MSVDDVAQLIWVDTSSRQSDPTIRLGKLFGRDIQTKWCKRAIPKSPTTSRSLLDIFYFLATQKMLLAWSTQFLIVCVPRALLHVKPVQPVQPMSWLYESLACANSETECHSKLGNSDCSINRKDRYVRPVPPVLTVVSSVVCIGASEIFLSKFEI